MTVLALALADTASPRLARGAAVAILVATVLYTGVFYRDYAYNQGTVTMISTETMTTFPYEAMGYDYLPAGGDLAMFDQVEITTDSEDTTAVWQGQGTVLCENRGTEPAAVNLPLLAYRYYTAADAETGTPLTLTENEEHCLQLTVPAGYCGTVQVRYTPPIGWHVAELVTLATLLGLIGWGVQDTRRRRREALIEETVQEETVYV